MSRICCVEGCGKHPSVGNLVSHANNRVKRWIYPNVHKMRFSYVCDAKKLVHRGAVCTKCIKSGKVKKII
jgi:large subunit ribosomal protein L28